MYSCLVKAAVFGEDRYDWYTYEGRTLQIPFRGITRPLERGQVFGVRKSTNGKQIRMVFDGDLTRVMSLDLPTAKAVAKGIKKGK